MAEAQHKIKHDGKVIQPEDTVKKADFTEEQWEDLIESGAVLSEEEKKEIKQQEKQQEKQEQGQQKGS